MRAAILMITPRRADADIFSAFSPLFRWLPCRWHYFHTPIRCFSPFIFTLPLIFRRLLPPPFRHALAADAAADSFYAAFFSDAISFPMLRRRRFRLISLMLSLFFSY